MGSKKGQTCGTILRRKGAINCSRHKKFEGNECGSDAKLEETVSEEAVLEEAVPEVIPVKKIASFIQLKNTPKAQKISMVSESTTSSSSSYSSYSSSSSSSFY